MTITVDPSRLTMTEIIRLQTLLSQELTRRFERNAALAFTDVVDSTPYFSQFGDEAGRRLQQMHVDLLERCLPSADGRIVDTAGDGAFAVFASASAAARAMAALQNRVSAENVDRPRAHQLCLRIGLHSGAVLTDGVQVTGDSVNLCARLAASALPGQVRLTRELLQQLDVELRVLCRPIGNAALKGLNRDVEAFEFAWRDPAKFPSEVLVRETGQRITLPARDTLSFGRGDTQDGASRARRGAAASRCAGVQAHQPAPVRIARARRRLPAARLVGTSHRSRRRCCAARRRDSNPPRHHRSRRGRHDARLRAQRGGAGGD